MRQQEPGRRLECLTHPAASSSEPARHSSIPSEPRMGAPPWTRWIDRGGAAGAGTLDSLRTRFRVSHSARSLSAASTSSRNSPTARPCHGIAHVRADAGPRQSPACVSQRTSIPVHLSAGPGMRLCARLRSLPGVECSRGVASKGSWAYCARHRDVPSDNVWQF